MWTIDRQTERLRLHWWLEREMPDFMLLREWSPHLDGRGSHGRVLVHLEKPLFQWPMKSTDGKGQGGPIWVPAVTLFSPQDAVLMAWRQK